jgi:hypothetical protein
VQRPVLSALDPSGVVLDERVLDSAFWADEWTDAAGVNWQIVPHTAMDGGSGRQFAGRVLRDGVEVGNWALEVQAERKAVVLHGVELREETAKGQGFGTARLARMAQRMEDAGVETVELKTGMSGFAVWPRMGFDVAAPPSDDWGSQRGQIARNVLDTAQSNAVRLRMRPSPETDPVALYHAQQRLAQMAAGEHAPSMREISEAGAGGVRGLFEGVQVRMSAAPAQVLREMDLRVERDVDGQIRSL